MTDAKVTMIPQHTNRTAKLIAVMMDGKHGDAWTDAELSRICGEEIIIGNNAYGSLQTATRHCRRNGVVWTRARGEGRIVCLNDAEKLQAANSIRQSIYRRSKAGLQVLASINRKDLPPEKVREYDSRTAQMATVRMFSEHSTLIRIEHKNTTKAVDKDAVLALFE